MNDKLIKVNLSKIDNFKEHPFLVNNDSSLMELVKSIKENGRYELISGHRIKKALEILEIQEIEVVLKELNDDEATIFMVDSNIYRERDLPSEKAFAYKMKMDAIKHQGKSLGTKYSKLRSSKVMARNNSDGEKTIRNYIRLTYLIPELLKLVDETILKTNKNGLTMGIKPAVELSYLGFAEQKLVLGVIEYCLATPSHAQAIKIKKIAKDKKIDSPQTNTINIIRINHFQNDILITFFFKIKRLVIFQTSLSKYISLSLSVEYYIYYNNDCTLNLLILKRWKH